MEALFSHLVAAVIGGGIVWYKDRTTKKQFQLMLEALDSGKQEGKGWKFVRDETGRATGFRVTLGASAATDKLDRL